ncbi:F-box domain protein [Colletotrichum truncatum]|uniref:F-box domain protein n=1 Tax=Colletotrichum truncatum TaxID=5467 RepID=A0ACC3YJV6_COLTU|nr:F-box domain protein [Colletotrichum truncatum]KAF6797418.1 F-box domain protein [Colletotrichum truncatum]
MPADDFQIIYKRASALGVEIPGATYPDACKKSAESDEHSDAANDDGTAEQFLTEMILVHTPNVRTIDYRVRNRTTIFGTLCSASNGMKRKPLFPKLIDFRMENLGSAQRVKPLAEWAPSLDSLWLETAQGPVAGLQFNTVRVLLLTKAQFNDAEMKELIRGFPNVKKFWFTWSINERIPTPSDYNQLLCSPQGVVDALQPLKAQLTELTLRFDDWQGFFCSHIRTEGPVNVVESFKDFEALQRLDIDGATLYDQTRNANESYDAHIARPLDGILPGSLKSLNLMDLRRGPVDDDLLTFASCAGNCCPELQRIDYQRSFRKGGMYRIPPAELSELKNEFGANGVIFESHNDTSHKPVSWRK